MCPLFRTHFRNAHVRHHPSKRYCSVETHDYHKEGPNRKESQHVVGVRCNAMSDVAIYSLTMYYVGPKNFPSVGWLIIATLHMLLVVMGCDGDPSSKVVSRVFPEALHSLSHCCFENMHFPTLVGSNICCRVASPVVPCCNGFVASSF